MSRRRIAFGAALVCSGALVSAAARFLAHSAPQPSTHPSSSSRFENNDLSYDAGEVLSGVTLSHAFLVTNPWPEPITIANDADIQRNCGCASLLPAARSLEPQAQTEVTVTVHTSGRHGPFANGGTIVWTTRNDRKRTTNFTLKGHALLPLQSEPAFLFFDKREVKDALTKDVVFTGNAAVDWTTLTVSSSSPYVQVIHLARHDNGARCKIRCSPPEMEPDFGAHLVARARLRSGPDLPADLTEVSTSLTVRAEQAVDLAILPKVVPVGFDASGVHGTARLLLCGQRVASRDSPIDSIRCDGYQVKWSLEKHAGYSAVLLVTLTRAAQEPAPARRALSIQIAGRRPVRVPFVPIHAVREGT